MNNTCSYKVMNNNDLRKIIFDFLPLYYCRECKKPTIENEYIHFANWICCSTCFRKNYRRTTKQLRNHYYQKALKDLR